MNKALIHTVLITAVGTIVGNYISAKYITKSA